MNGLIEKLITNIKSGLPNKRILESVNVGAIECGGKYVVLKTRFTASETLEMLNDKGKVKYYNGQFEDNELLGQCVIYDKDLLNRSGKESLEDLTKIIKRDDLNG